MATIVASFGFRHGKPLMEKNALCIDVRLILPKNPYHNKKLRALRGDDQPVIDELERTPGMQEAYQALLIRCRAHSGPVYLGCTGGHHRSVYLADRIGQDLGVETVHLNYGDK